MARVLRVVFDMRFGLTTLALATTLSLSGCFIAVEDDDDFVEPVPIARGDLSIFWSFEGFRSCGPVDEVRVTLIDPEGFVYDDSGYGCGIEGLVYEELDEGWWIVDLEGLDRYGRLLYVASTDVYVTGNAFNEYDIDLTIY